MTTFATLTTDANPTRALQKFLASLLDNRIVEAVLVPARQPDSLVVMPSLISDVRCMAFADPLAPVLSTNAAVLLSTITRNPLPTPVAAVLRSCEARAFVERTKLNQGQRDGVLLIGMDCYGRMENRDYLALAEGLDEPAHHFLRMVEDPASPFTVPSACKACEFPVAPSVDLRLCWIGTDPFFEIRIEAVTEAGAHALDALGLTPRGEFPARKQAVRNLETKRIAFRDAYFEEFRQRTSDSTGLRRALAACINCYNCRVACPLCYCRECVFSTDLFRHDGTKCLMWARKTGLLRMPTDTVFYHLTRMVHMSTMCVGCGQCSSACPNGIEVMELFRTTAIATQARFQYLPGRDLNEKQPMATFHDDELQEATGNGS